MSKFMRRHIVYSERLCFSSEAKLSLYQMPFCSVLIKFKNKTNRVQQFQVTRLGTAEEKISDFNNSKYPKLSTMGKNIEKIQ